MRLNLLVASVGALAIGAGVPVARAQDLGFAGTPDAHVTGTGAAIEPDRVWTWNEMVRQDRARAAFADPAIAPAPSIPEGGELGPPTAPLEPVEAPPKAADRAVCPPLVNPTITDSFLGLDDGAVTIPPDTMGAVGPDHIMVMLNDRVCIQDRAGASVSTVTLATFWAASSPSSPFDPVVIYDSISGRWIACAASHRRSANSKVMFAISANSDPTGAWTFYSIDAHAGNTAWVDFPRMGLNATWIALTGNMFTIAADSFVGAGMWVIDTASALAGGPLTITTFAYSFDNVGGAFGTALTPATTYSGAEPSLWIIDSAGFTSGGVQVHRLSRITGTGPAPVWSVAPGGPFPGSGVFTVATNYATSTPTANQLGTATRIATNGARIYDAELRNGRLWYCHAGGLPTPGPTRTSAFWYEINPTAALGSNIVQSGVIDATGVYHFFPSIAVNCNADMMIGFTRSSASIYAEAAFTHRHRTDAPGTTRAVHQLKAGEDSYIKDFGSGTVRWGDYSATVVDPIDDRGMWTIQEYAALDVGPTANDDRWGTWWGRLFAPEIPCIGDINDDGFTNVSDFNILATNYRTAVPPNTGGDLNGDGLVNVSDFNILASDFRCPF